MISFRDSQAGCIHTLFTVFLIQIMYVKMPCNISVSVHRPKNLVSMRLVKESTAFMC